MHFIGLPVRIEDPQREIDWISALWDRFYREMIFDEIPNQKSGDIYGVYYNFAGDHTQPYTFLAGCEVTSTQEIPKGLVAHSVPAAEYAYFEIIGSFPDNLIDKWQKIRKSDLKRSFKTDFERYGPKFNTVPPVVELYININS